MKKYLEYVWIVLIFLTIFAYALGYTKYINDSLVALLLVTTFIKGMLVIDYFMGLKDVESKYRIIPIAWLGIVIPLLALAYYLPI